MAQLAFGCVSCAARTTCLDFVHAPEGLGQLTEPLTTFKYMIPIGSPVTVTWGPDRKTNHTVRYVSPCNKYSRYHLDGMWIAHEDYVKIRYDSPAPFTLWQLNVLAQEDANDDWIHEPQQLAPNHIAFYWEWSVLNIISINPIKPLIRYSNPCPFTLWSWNSELKLDANAPWRSMFGDLSPKSITDYRKVVAGWGKLS